MKSHRLLASLLEPITAAVLLVQSVIAADLPAKPLRVFSLAGQSNMEGQGIVTAQDTDGSAKPGTLVSTPLNSATVLRCMAWCVFTPRRHAGGSVVSVQVPVINPAINPSHKPQPISKKILALSPPLSCCSSTSTSAQKTLITINTSKS